jgi:pSer/pThr/pTyr-binding forkhead associated (FHA) protein
MEVTLNIYTSGDVKQVPMNSDRITVGRGSTASVSLEDEGLSRLHISIHRDGDRLWVLDEGSTNGSLVNGVQVPPAGTPLKEGDEISIGNHTSILVSFNPGAVPAPPIRTSASDSSNVQVNEVHSSSTAALKLSLLFAALVILIAGVALAAHSFRSKPNESTSNNKETALVQPSSEPVKSPESKSDQATPAANDATAVTPAPSRELSVVTAGPRKLYLQMNRDEQMLFIEQEARHISLMMGNRPYAFNDDVLRYIKQYLDGYAKRVGNNSSKLWAEDLRSMFARASGQYAPYIIRSFNARGVPPVVGLYLVVVETEYHNIHSENAAGAAGLFQFIGPTARGYGVDPSERTNVSKMAPAAAAYMADRIAEFGTDSMSVALAIAGYNRSPDSVRRDLHDVLNSENKERSFWTLVANSNKLDHYFQGENIKYVPKFFAAAIVGENPWVFGIQMQPLSTYTDIKAVPAEAKE